MRFYSLFSLVLLLAIRTSADDSCLVNKIKENLEVIQSNGTAIRPSGFEVRRNLDQYKNAFGLRFSAHLNDLVKGDVWIDLGAGSGDALLDFLGAHPNQGVKTVGVAWVKPPPSNATYAKAETHFESTGAFKFLQGGRLEEIPRAELPQSQVITDLMGPMAYTHDLPLILRLELSLLKDEKSALFITVDSRTSIETPQGARTLSEWISSIKGLTVSTSQNHGFTVLEIHKLEPEPSIPELSLKHLQPGMPPVRVFGSRRRR